MRLGQIRGVLEAPDIETRNRLITAHLDDLQDGLAETQSAVASLRDLLERPSSPQLPGINHRRGDATPVAAISEVVATADAGVWLQGALGELYATLAAEHTWPSGPPGDVYADELFTDEVGRATVFVPCERELRATGRVMYTVIPPVELATILHSGPHRDIDRAYGALAAHVAEHELGVDGPLREYYLVGMNDTHDATAWRTEIGWPIFVTGGSASSTRSRVLSGTQLRTVGRVRRCVGAAVASTGADQGVSDERSSSTPMTPATRTRSTSAARTAAPWRKATEAIMQSISPRGVTPTRRHRR
jgi:effector-binding domain-containing protein